MYKHHEQLFLTTPAADLISRISLLEEFGMDRGAIAEAVQHCLPLLFFDIQEKLQPLLLLLETLGINKSPFVGKLIKYNPHKVITSAEPSIRRFLDFCSDYSVSLEQGSLCIRKYPLIVIFSSDNMYRLVDFLGEFNLEKAEIGMLVRRDPRLLTRNVEKSMRPTVEFLMELGVDRDGIATIIKKQPNLFGFSVQLSLKPKIEYLQDVGFGGIDLAKLLTVEPAVLTRSITDCLDSKVRVLQGLGFEMGSLILGRALSFAYSTSIDYLEDRVKWFLSHGFSRKETFLILRCNPCLLRSKTTQLQKKVDYLVNTMQYPMKDVVIYPQFLSLSLENRIIPRYRVMVWLKTVGLLNRNLSLSFFTRLTDEKFRRKYVDCYPGCCTAFETNEGSISH
ncbi:hypothetical protein O6H91_17G046800 [Diphasiastrum complanatum]|nr:hypothetical protein O6H91_17G046800 [Diphasiastrum complanatum]